MPVYGKLAVVFIVTLRRMMKHRKKHVKIYMLQQGLLLRRAQQTTERRRPSRTDVCTCMNL